jgi:predicted Holliday junction resolvase-like endonuclease
MGFPEVIIILVIITPFALIFYFVFYRVKKRRKNLQMNQENISSAEAGNKSAITQTSIEDKLGQLNELKENNLINDEEYNKKKEKLLEEL